MAGLPIVPYAKTLGSVREAHGIGGLCELTHLVTPREIWLLQMLWNCV